MKFILHKTIFVLVCVMLAACTSEEDRRLEQQAKNQAELTDRSQLTEMQLNSLKNHINSGTVKNTEILKLYGATVKKDKPELAELVDALTKDATINGPTFQSLDLRLKGAKADIPLAASLGSTVNRVMRELELIDEAASPSLYNMILTDPINVLADMSDGKLARVEAMSKKAMEAAEGGNQSYQGSQLVGNPNYGHWQRDNNGGQVWMWLAAYSMFSNLHRPVYYNNWSTGRHYSYYHDIGRSHYTSPSQYKQQKASQTVAKAKFKKQGKTFTSPYAKTKVGATATTAKPKSSSNFKSSYSNSTTSSSSSSKPKSSTSSNNFKSSYSSSNSTLSSARNTDTRISRGTSGGK